MDQTGVLPPRISTTRAIPQRIASSDASTMKEEQISTLFLSQNGRVALLYCFVICIAEYPAITFGLQGYLLRYGL